MCECIIFFCILLAQKHSKLLQFLANIRTRFVLHKGKLRMTMKIMKIF